jgi:deoxycytidylate deaminase
LYNLSVVPENVLIGDDCVKLTDYGLKMEGKKQKPKRTNILYKKDNINYMINAYTSPEELNAILNARGNIAGCTMYTTLFPCAECAKAIIQSGINRVVYMDIKADKAYTAAAKRMFKAACVTFRQYKTTGVNIRLSL